MAGPDSAEPEQKSKVELVEQDPAVTGNSSGAASKEPGEELKGGDPDARDAQTDLAFSGTDDSVSDGVAADDLAAGHVIADQYEIVSVLGRGGMSVVYKAQDRLMRRVVAVKCLHAHLLSDKSSILRFQKEAQAAGNLNHPHIVRIYQFGLDNDQRPFFVMDYLEGQSLQELLDRGNKIEVQEALRILVEAADGLEQAHKKGMVHRDFKPSNIMLVDTEEGKNRVKIVDFGIAKVITAPGDEGHNLTRTGEMLGSPKYMSPEQCMVLDLDNRSDIYAFGCTMFAILTGHAPFTTGSVVEIYYKQMSELPQSISISRPDIQEAALLDAIILKCMAKEPSDRYQNMADVTAAIQKIIDGSNQNLVESIKDQMELSKLKGKAQKTQPRSAQATAMRWLLIVSAMILTLFSSTFLTVLLSSGSHESLYNGAERKLLNDTHWVTVPALSPAKEGSLRALSDDTPTKMLFINWTGGPVKLYELNSHGKRQACGEIAPDGHIFKDTFATHPYVLTDNKDKALAAFIALPEPGTATLRK